MLSMSAFRDRHFEATVSERTLSRNERNRSQHSSSHPTPITTSTGVPKHIREVPSVQDHFSTLTFWPLKRTYRPAAHRVAIVVLVVV